MGENGRQINSIGPQLVPRKPPSRSIVLECVKDEVFYRWCHRGEKERIIATKYGVSREHVEEIVRERVRNQRGGGPSDGPNAPGGVVIPIRKLAA